MTHRGITVFTAALQITVSTWGPSFRSIQLLYTAVVRPTLLYKAQIWGIKLNDKLLAKGFLAPLMKLQNQCLHRTTKAYKKMPNAALKHETAVPLLNLYINTVVMQRAITVQSHPVKENIQ